MIIADILAQCEDPDAQLALFALRKHMRRLERTGYRVALVSDQQLARDTQRRQGVRRVPGVAAYRAYSPNYSPWLHLSRSFVRDALRTRPRDLGDLCDFMEDARLDARGRVAR